MKLESLKLEKFSKKAISNEMMRLISGGNTYDTGIRVSGGEQDHDHYYMTGNCYDRDHYDHAGKMTGTKMEDTAVNGKIYSRGIAK